MTYLIKIGHPNRYRKTITISFFNYIAAFIDRIKELVFYFFCFLLPGIKSFIKLIDFIATLT